MENSGKLQRTPDNGNVVDGQAKVDAPVSNIIACSQLLHLRDSGAVGCIKFWSTLVICAAGYFRTLSLPLLLENLNPRKNHRNH